MDNSVNTEAPAPATVFAFAPETEAVVDAPQEEAVESVDEGEQTPTENPVEESEDSVVVDAPSEGKQKDIGAAFAKESARIRKQYEKKLANDPLRSIGKLMVDDLMSQEEITEEEAIKKVNDNFLKAVAKRDNISPNVAKKLYGKEPVIDSTENQVMDILEAVEAAEKPDGFDDSAYNDPKFADLLTRFPAEAAIRIYVAEQQAANAPQDIAEKLRARKAIPQSITPQKSAAPKKDWMSVSSEEFAAEKARRNKYR